MPYSSLILDSCTAVASAKWFLVGKPSEFNNMYDLITFHGEHPTSSTVSYLALASSFVSLSGGLSLPAMLV